jgi:threonine/homoserine/homoserine lactone efflux protein
MSLFKIYGILAVIVVIFIGLSLLISKRINSYLSDDQTKEKEIKQKIIIHDNKTLFRNILDSIFLAALAIMMVAPVIYIFSLVFHLLFPLSPKETATQLIAVIYITISCITVIVLFIYALKWLNGEEKTMTLPINKHKQTIYHTAALRLISSLHLPTSNLQFWQPSIIETL